MRGRRVVLLRIRPYPATGLGLGSAAMRVLFVLEDLRIGGAQRHALALAAGLTPPFVCEVLSLSAASAETLAPPSGVVASHLGLRPLRPGAWRPLAAAIAVRRPDLVVTVNPVATLAVAAARAVGAPRTRWAVLFHTTTITDKGAALRTAPFIPVARGCDALVYVSANQKRHWERHGLRARRIEVILNGVPTQRYASASDGERATAKTRLGWGPQDRVFGAAAVMRPEKNLVHLVDALAVLRADGLPARLLLIGDGPERDRVEARARSLGVEDSLAITGFRDDVRPFLAALDVGALPSLAVETLPLFALEAMASGVPMVLSDIGGAGEIVTDKRDGRLVPVRDLAALTCALADCLEPATRASLSSTALATARARFDEVPMLAAYADLFTALIGGRS